MMMRALLLCAAAVTSGCMTTVQYPDPAMTASAYIGLEERINRTELRELVGVDPVRTEWCAAFVNAILEKDSIPGSDSVSDYPLTARSFLDWGEPVQRPDIRRGDIVVFPRGTAGWQGHVGFYVETQMVDGVEYWVILGGNQDNTVSYALYRSSSSLGVRRYPAIQQ